MGIHTFQVFLFFFSFVFFLAMVPDDVLCLFVGTDYRFQ